ncbi:hypothetical protein Bca4012_053206 [Brassica carinata]
MEKYERLSEEETYWWMIPFKFLDQTLKAIFKCLGLLHHESPSTKTESFPVTSTQPLQQEEEEEEEDVVMEENVIITYKTQNHCTILRITNLVLKLKEFS